MTQSKDQKKIWGIWKKLFSSVEDHKDKLTVILNGDLVEGVHHASKQLMTLYMQEQEKIAIDAIDKGLIMANWGNPEDELYFIDGTAVHADESEERIAMDFQSIPFSENRITHPSLMLRTDIGDLWIAHKGTVVGQGWNTGNSLRNKVKLLCVECMKSGKKPPRMVVYSHRHVKAHEVIEMGDYKIDAWITPAFCDKSEFGYTVDPFGIREVGGLKLHIGDNLNWEWVTCRI